MTAYRFEVIIDFFEDHDKPDEDYLDFQALYYGDKHQDFGLTTVPGTVQEIER